MLHGKKIVVVLPAYRAEKTLEDTYHDIPHDIVDCVFLVDDGSDDQTVGLAQNLGIQTFIHESNLGYGANQKTCYLEALRSGGEIVVMLHPDYQYDPRLVTAMAAMVASDVYDVVIGSRLTGSRMPGYGMPLYKYVANRVLTGFQNIMLGTRLSEFHTGYRAFSRKVLETLPLLANANGFVFDNQMLTQAVAFGFSIGEVSCPTNYFPDASSIGLLRSVVYGFKVLSTSVVYRLWRWQILHPDLFSPSPTLRLTHSHPSYSDGAR
jgi:glycosyltransferase involved in cell wall biosynthesis